MLNKDLFFSKFDKLLLAFPNWKIKFDDVDTVKFWYEKFKHLSNERFSHMVDEYMKNEKFNPTIAGLKEYDNLPVKSYTQIEHERMLKEHGML